MTVRPIRPDELLELADDLAGRGAGAGRPRTIRLRRAISSAYYALFHEVCMHATEQLVHALPTDSRYAAVARWFDHVDLQKLANGVISVGGAQPSAVASVFAVVHPDLKRSMVAFLNLQAARHLADYDHRFDVSRAAALALIDASRDAVHRLRNLSDAREPSYELFLRLMVGATKIAKAR